MALTIESVRWEGTEAGIRCDGDRIVAIGPGVRPEAGDEVVDGRGLICVPPLVNGHTHAAMTLFRGFGDDLPLMEWLETKIWPAEAKLEPEDVYWGTRLAALEMIRTGTTRFCDVYWHGTEVARAAADAGIRVMASSVMIDGLDPAKGRALRDRAVETLDRLAAAGPLIEPCFGPHAIYTVSRDSLEWIAGTAAERGVHIQIHLSETEGEVSDCVREHGMRPAAYLDEIGMLGPHTLLGHGVWLDHDEMALLAERRATVVSNPAANMKLAVGGAFPYARAAAAGVPIALGTDGVSSNSNLDMFEEMKLFALLQKHADADPASAPAHEVLEIARGHRSPALDAQPLAPGAPADFLLLRGDAIELSAGTLDADLVYAAPGSVVDTTVVAGRVLMRGGEIEGEAEVIGEVRDRAARLTA